MAEIVSGSPSTEPFDITANVVLPNPPAPEREFPERTDGDAHAPKAAGANTGLQPMTIGNPEGQLPPVRLIG